MFKGKQSPVGEIQGQTIDGARDFFGNSVGYLKSRLESDRSQLQSLMETLPESQEEARSQLQKLVGSYEDIEYMVGRAVQKQEVEDTVEQVVRRAGETSQPADHLPPGSILLGETTDKRGRTVQRSVDESGDIMETTLDESGELVGEDISGTVTDLPAEEEYIDGAGRPVRTVEDESGQHIGLTLGDAGEVLDLEVSGETAGKKEPDATSAARHKARQLGVDLSRVKGSGTGRITLKDVLDAARRG